MTRVFAQYRTTLLSVFTSNKSQVLFVVKSTNCHVDSTSW